MTTKDEEIKRKFTEQLPCALTDADLPIDTSLCALHHCDTPAYIASGLAQEVEIHVTYKGGSFFERGVRMVSK